MDSQSNAVDFKKNFQESFENQTQSREKFKNIATASISSMIGMATLLIDIFDNSTIPSIFIGILVGLAIGINMAIRKKEE